SDPAEHNRRGVYLFVKRSFRDPMMEVFDAPDTAASCPRRESSTVAPQSLAMMNGRFLGSQSDAFAARVGKVTDPVGAAWSLALSRVPSAEEKSRAVAYSSKAGLAKLCRLLFNMSEFLYVD